MCSIAQVIRRFKQDWTRQLDDQHLLEVCQLVKFAWRDRNLPPVYTIKLFLLQILWGKHGMLRRAPFRRSATQRRSLLPGAAPACHWKYFSGY